ncbi:MAG: hypothetical protein JWP83_295 [Mycobacterium sp.]|jgi:hypothetical protein|nr:hypothetical protein [Mycobacterium sp.]
MESERFRKLLDAPGPFASVYFDDSHDTHDAEAQLDLRWRAVREELEKQGASQAVIDEIGTTITDLRPPIGRSGRAVVASADGVVINEHLARPAAASIVRVSELPYIVPILELSFDHPDYVLVVVDHSGADITTHIGGTLHSETVDGGGYPVHKAAGAETAGYGDPQLRTDEAARKNVRAVANRVSELVDDKGIEVIFVVGPARTARSRWGQRWSGLRRQRRWRPRRLRRSVSRPRPGAAPSRPARAPRQRARIAGRSRR